MEFLISFLRSEHNIYEWQEPKALQTVLRFGVRVDRPDIDLFIDSARNTNKHYAVRAFCLLLVGKHGSNRDRELIVDLYNASSEIYTKEAVVLAVQELGEAARNDFYSRVKRCDSNGEISQFIDYVKRLKEPLYYLTTERPKIETYEESEEPSYEPI